jgi:hypothetical protein
MSSGSPEVAGAVAQPTALVIGAGFSKWAAGLPIAEGLFDFRITPLDTTEQRRIDRLKAEKRHRDDDNRAGLAEQFVAYMLQKTDRTHKTVLWYVTRRLSEPFVASILGGRQTLMIDDARARTLRGVQRVQRFLEKFSASPISGIVTANYDLLLEYALGTQAFNYGTKGEILQGRGKNPMFPWQSARPVLCGDLPIAKIHGSVSWTESARFTDGRCGLRGDALIVPPHADKIRPAVLEQTWHLAESILRPSFKALVFGFGFNSYDDQLLSLLAAGGRQLKDVLLVDVAPKVEAAQKLWPSAQITTCFPPPRGDRAIAAWIYSRYVLRN